MDLVLVHTNSDGSLQVNSFLNNGANAGPSRFSSNPTASTQLLLPSSVAASNIFVGDANGDGNADLIVAVQSVTNNVETLTTDVLLSLGNGALGPLPQTTQWGSIPYHGLFTPVVGNFDGDGRASIAWMLPGLTSIDFDAAIGDGTYFNVSTPLASGSVSGQLFAAADFSGQGQDQVLADQGSPSGNPPNYIFSNPWVGSKHITNIADGYGETTAITYTPITNSAIYTDDNQGASFPTLPMRTAYYVVSQTNVKNPGNTDKITSYHYKDARFNWYGLGFVGFSNVTSTDISWRAGGSVRSSTDYHLDFPFIGEPLDGTVTDLQSGHNVHGFFDSWKSKALSFGSNFVYLDSSQSADWDLQTGVVYRTQQYSGSYDDYGCPQTTTDTVYTGDVGATPAYTTSTTNTITEDTTNWFLCQINDIQVTRSATGEPNVTRESLLTYDPTTGLLKEETVQPQDRSDQYLDTSYQRDAFGNIKSATTSGYSSSYLTPRTVNYNYSPDGRFLTSICNSLQPCTNFTYYADTGNVNTVTDSNGLVATYSQDTFGRPSGSSINQADLNVSTAAAWYWCTDANLSSLCKDALSGVYGRKVTASDGSAFAVIYDQAQRPVMQGQLNGGGSWIETLTQYDIEGRRYKTSASQYVGTAAASTFWITTNYDDLNRPYNTVAPQDQNHPTSSATGYTYNGLSTTINDPRGHNKTITKTALDQLASVTDDSNSTLTYSYDAFGNLLQTVDPKGNTVAMSYDVRGRKTQISDPDMGTWSYAYDSLGELITQRSAKLIGNKTSFGYDVLGRPTSRSNADNSYTWTWDKGTGSQWYGALIEATMYPSGSTTPVYDRSYAYTDFGGLKTDQQTVNGTVYVTKYGYDTLGRVNLLTYPSTFAVNIGYNGYGAESSITDASTGGITLWSANAWDEWGHIYQETLGGSAVVNGVYLDAAVGNTMGIVAGPNGGASVANFSYAWDANGNTTVRAYANANGLAESLSYDNLDRLQMDSVTNAVSPTANITFGYDALGNVSSKSDLSGTYAYTLGLPHAVSGAGGMTYSYDKNGSMTGVSGSDKRSYTWTADNTLSNAKDTSATYQVGFQYGADGELVSQVASWGLFYNKSQTTLYLGDGLEEAASGTLGTTTKDYIMAPTGPVAMVVHAPSSADAVQYLQKDNLDSIVAVTDANGNVVQSYVYDTVGKRTATYTATGYSGLLTDLGYTGHIQIDSLNLVHMKGRVYDATIARFLSGDPVVQDPTDLQSFNRYSYVGNSPLTMVDPSGFDGEDGGDPSDDPGGDSGGDPSSDSGGAPSSNPSSDSGGNSGDSSGTPSYFTPYTVNLDPTLGPGLTPADQNSPYGSDPMNEVTVWAPMLLPPNADLGDGGQSGSPLVGGVGAVIGASGAGVAGATSSVTGANIPFSGMASSGSSQNPKGADGSASAAAQYAHGLQSWFESNFAAPFRSLDLSDELNKGLQSLPGEGPIEAGVLGIIASSELRTFRSFSSFKRALGPAGLNKQWHHIVEQTPGNVDRFGPQAIHSTDNMLRVDQATHQKISAYYSSVRPFTEGMTVRQWLSPQSFDEQRAFGLDVLTQYGISP
jgi:RHS repeat-associated protein